MKKLLLITVIIFTVCVTKSNAQDYGKVEYWGKTYILDRSFFSYLNQNMDYFIKVTAPQWRWYDSQDYSDIYVGIVNYLRNTNNKIIVTEANQLQFSSSTDFMPGQMNEVPKRNKKSTGRAGWVLNSVLLPALQQFVNGYESTHQFHQ
jgi:hypothetical protein